MLRRHIQCRESIPLLMFFDFTMVTSTESKGHIRQITEAAWDFFMHLIGEYLIDKWKLDTKFFAYSCGLHNGCFPQLTILKAKI